MSISANITGFEGVTPRTVYIKCNNTLAEVTTANFLAGAQEQGYIFYPTDIFNIAYLGRSGIFIPTFTGNSITLSNEGGDVTLPVVSNDFAVFDGTSGTIKDAGYSPSDAAKTKVVMANGAVTINHIAQFADTAGTLKDGGVLGTAAAKAASDNSKASLASVNGATVINNLLKASDIVGTVQDSGIAASAVQLAANIKAGHTADIGGAGAGPITITLAGITTASTIVANIISSSNVVGIAKVTPGTGNYTVLFDADPGAACILSYVAFIAAQ